MAVFRAMSWIQGLPFEVRPSSFAEDLDKSRFSQPSEYVVENARCKALDVVKGVERGVVIGADTVVVSVCVCASLYLCVRIIDDLSCIACICTYLLST